MFRVSALTLTALAALSCTSPDSDADGRDGQGGQASLLPDDAGVTGGAASTGTAGDGGTGGGPSGGAGTGGDGGAPDPGVEYLGPQLLSGTGLYADVRSRTLNPGVFAYDVTYPLWTDGAFKERYLWIPEGKLIDTTDMDSWEFPIGTKAWKAFSRDGTGLVETRFLEKKAPGKDGWTQVAYVWREDGTDAEPAPLGVENALGTPHDVPTMEQCGQCHTGSRDFLIGVSAVQLSGTGFLEELVAEGLLSSPPSGEIRVPGAGVQRKALGYLHGNCGYCHSDEYFLADKRALRLNVRVQDATPEETLAYLTALNAPTTHIMDDTTRVIVPGSAKDSQLYLRMGYIDESAMPPLGRETVDDAASELIKRWIDEM